MLANKSYDDHMLVNSTRDNECEHDWQNCHRRRHLGLAVHPGLEAQPQTGFCTPRTTESVNIYVTVILIIITLFNVGEKT